jgi:uncharacterized Fe-S radical SAM superfamily protein PflX
MVKICAKGKRGDCRVRENRDGKYFSLVYGNPCALHLDPIEKKPLFHFHPGTLAFSLGSWGCNFHCEGCQNWQISCPAVDELAGRGEHHTGVGNGIDQAQRFSGHCLDLQ